MDIKQQKAIEISAKRTELANEVNTEWTPIYLNETEKITISPHHWIGLYCELSEFVLTNKIGESIFIQDENGDETINELYQDEYIEIVNEVEDILSNHFIKEGF